MSNASSMPEPKVLLDGLAYVESPRWHESRLWFAHWGTGEIVAVDLDGVESHKVVPMPFRASLTKSYRSRYECTPIDAKPPTKMGGLIGRLARLA